MRISHLFLFCLVFAIGGAGAGCNKKEDTQPISAKTNKPAPTSPTVAAPKGDGSGEAGLPVDQVPAELKTEGYAYYGLEHGQPIEFEVVMPKSTTAETGSATTKLTAVKDGVATFITERTGPLESLGAEELIVKKDGIYNTKIGGQPVEPVQLVMPADVHVGKVWASKGKIKLQNGQTFTQDMQFKVAGQGKVKTKAGEFDALRVTAQGEIRVGDKRSQSNITAWYVKGLGTVKMEITTSNPPGKMTVEATKTS
jgi:hypothetical protein